MHGIGVIGSCRWRMSNRSRSSVRADARNRARAEDDVRQRSVRRHDHRAPDRDHVGRRIAVPPVARMQHARELTGRIVAHDRLHLDAPRAERFRLELGVLDDGAPEGPRVRHDDPDLHRGHYRRRAVRVRSPHDREILRLALPALGALAAEPLYVLVDTAIVGPSGPPAARRARPRRQPCLGGAFSIFNFLAYGTTAVVARAAGAGQEERAARLAAQALWLALAIGLGLVVGARGDGRPAPARPRRRTGSRATSRSPTSGSRPWACCRR